MKTTTNKNYVLTPPNSVECDNEPLNYYLDVWTHDTVFSWGYDGAGPAQLALAIMCNEFGPDLAKHPIHYMDLRRDFISNLAKGITHRFDTKTIHKIIRETQNG